MTDPNDPAAFGAIAAAKAEKAPEGAPAPVLRCMLGDEEHPLDPIPPQDDPAKTWIEIVLTDTTGHPMVGEVYQVFAPTGEEHGGKLDENGFARVDGIDPGTAKVNFPRFDRRLWREV